MENNLVWRCRRGIWIYTAANDPYWEIERREKWAERQSDETFAFREDVLSSPNLVAVLTGHWHRHVCACVRGKHLFSIPANRDGYHWSVRIGSAVDMSA